MEERTLIETVLLHRRRPCLLLRSHLLSRLRHDQHLRERIRADAAEACPLGLYRLRRRGDTHSSRGSCFGRYRLLQPEGPDYTEQHLAGGPCVPGILVRNVPDRAVLDIGKS
jgi:hypothetical protein